MGPLHSISLGSGFSAKICGLLDKIFHEHVLVWFTLAADPEKIIRGLVIYLGENSVVDGKEKEKSRWTTQGISSRKLPLEVTRTLSP